MSNTREEQLRISVSNRWCKVKKVKRLDSQAMRKDILLSHDIESGFSISTTPAPTIDDTVFKVASDGKRVLFAFALYNSVDFLSSRTSTNPEDVVELLFDLRNDQCGFFQFLFTPPQRLAEPDKGLVQKAHRDREEHKEVECLCHQPYKDYRQSNAFDLEPLRYEWKEEQFSPCPITPIRMRWLYVWFRHKDIFQHGRKIGFNAVRCRPCVDEFGAWNYVAGNGSADAAHFGKLYETGTVPSFHIDEAIRKGSTLTLTGSGLPAKELCLIGPTGDKLSVKAKRCKQGWQITAQLPREAHGRFRLAGAQKNAEPAYVAVDVPAQEDKGFNLSVLYDSPMCIISNHYTPARLRKEMELWKSLGLDRVHVQNYSDWPSFWTQPVHYWHHHYPDTKHACGNYFKAVVKAARQAGLEAIGDHKIFDLGFNSWFVEPDGKSTVEDIDSRHVPVIPELAEHPEWCMQANPEWLHEPAFPIATIRLYSEEEMPKLEKKDVRILVSDDNRTFRRYRGKFEFKAHTVRRNHKRWTPAGLESARGSAKNYCVEISGLAIRSPYVAVQLGQNPWNLQHRGYMVAEAESADGSPAPLTVATNGSSEDGFFFWKGWMGWNNHNEPLLNRRLFPGNDFGMVFRESPSMPTLLEPAFEGARNIWLQRLRHSLKCGADGVAIRTYCHHNGMMNYLKYTFAAPVREEFMSRYGRAPKACEEDYYRIRRIRGEFFSEFMRAGSNEAHSRGRKFIAILESGVEVPPQLDVRMHLPLEWRRWITEGWLDEIRLKYFTAESRFVHEEVMPLARKHNVRVNVTSRCLHTGVGLRGVELAGDTIRRAHEAGFDGYCLYEQQNLMEMNPFGIATLKGRVVEWFAEARKYLDS